MAIRAFLALTAAGLAGVALALAGCGSDENGDNATPATSTAAAAAAAPTEASTKVSANEASREELTQALEAAGIPSAEKWAEEIEEYRPYPVDDPSWTHLRTELAKYNPPPEVLEQIIATLKP